jgi:hypothetical protein
MLVDEVVRSGRLLIVVQFCRHSFHESIGVKKKIQDPSTATKNTTLI